MTVTPAVDVHPEENWGEVTELLDRLQRGGELISVEASARPIARVADETPA